MVSEANWSKLSAALFRPSAPDDRTFKVVCKANDHYTKKEFKLAIDEYTKALSLIRPSSDPKKSSSFSALIFSNRSASYYQCKKWAEAVKDADQVIRMRPEWPKGYFRKAEANIQLGKYDEALKDYYMAQRKDPKNTQIPLRIAKTLTLKDNQEMNLAIYALIPGRDICLHTITNPIQNKIFDFAKDMKNIIYIIADLDTRKCVVVDACWDVDGILKFVKKKGLELVGSIVTHYHFDHVGGIPPPPFDQLRVKVSGIYNLMRRVPKLSVYMHPADIPYVLKSNPGMSGLRSRIISTPDQFTMTLGNFTLLRFIHMPGHTEGSQSILVNETRLFSGDTLMVGCTGRLDLPGGNLKEMKKTLTDRLGNLEDGTVVYPGHKYGREWTTIGMEREKGVIGRTRR
ncbi:11738_t:CDS:2 [Funneliformis geosporum]|uniref:7394_t:CDS:1 n=1 Tax=Funneliformis geosporum TaxID=1117311 RepID=A0A9W4X1Y6_9GLOM|nr:11738_t:CDS:2 [Funneliformis geosporum]CAI2189280.1 7394_t:CDS:2 [Funneliformis geosporum]